jgi:hypothetical protein
MPGGEIRIEANSPTNLPCWTTSPDYS